MSPPGSPCAVVMPASGNQVGPPSSTPPPPPKRCLFIPTEAQYGSLGPHTASGQGWSARPSAPAGWPGLHPTCAPAGPSGHDQPTQHPSPGRRTRGEVSMLRSDRCWPLPLPSPGKEQTHVTDEENRVQRERLAHIHAASYLSPGLQTLKPVLLPAAAMPPYRSCPVSVCRSFPHKVKTEEAQTREIQEGLRSWILSVKSEERRASLFVTLSTLQGRSFRFSVCR